MKLGILFAVALVAMTAHALAGSVVKVDDRSIVLVQPAGYCELQPEEKSDARVLQAIRGMIEPIGNALLAAAAECDTLRNWRNGKVTRLKNMTQYQVYTRATKDGSPEETNAAVKDLCDELRQSGKQETENMNPSVKERAAKVMEKIEYGKIEMVGVTDEEPGACYVTLLQKFRAEDKTDVTQLVTYATTLVRGKWIYFYLFSDYENADSVTTALAYHKKNVHDFMAANRP